MRKFVKKAGINSYVTVYKLHYSFAMHLLELRPGNFCIWEVDLRHV